MRQFDNIVQGAPIYIDDKENVLEMKIEDVPGRSLIFSWNDRGVRIENGTESLNLINKTMFSSLYDAVKNFESFVPKKISLLKKEANEIECRTSKFSYKKEMIDVFPPIEIDVPLFPIFSIGNFFDPVVMDVIAEFYRKSEKKSEKILALESMRAYISGTVNNRMLHVFSQLFSMDFILSQIGEDGFFGREIDIGRETKKGKIVGSVSINRDLDIKGEVDFVFEGEAIPLSTEKDIADLDMIEKIGKKMFGTYGIKNVKGGMTTLQEERIFKKVSVSVMKERVVGVKKMKDFFKGSDFFSFNVYTNSIEAVALPNEFGSFFEGYVSLFFNVDTLQAV